MPRYRREHLFRQDLLRRVRANLRFQVWHSNDPYRKVVWHCNDKFKNGRKCETPTVTEEEIKAAFERVLRKLAADKTEVIENLQEVVSCSEDQAAIQQKEKLERERDTVARDANEAINENARVAQNQNKYNERYAELVSEYDRLDAEVKQLEREAERQKAQKRRIAEFIKALENTEEKFTEDDWCIMVEKVTVYTGRIVFTLVTGSEIEA